MSCSWSGPVWLGQYAMLMNLAVLLPNLLSETNQAKGFMDALQHLKTNSVVGINIVGINSWLPGGQLPLF